MCDPPSDQVNQIKEPYSKRAKGVLGASSEGDSAQLIPSNGTILVQLDETDQTTRLSIDLLDDQIDRLTKFLLKNKDCFAWNFLRLILQQLYMFLIWTKQLVPFGSFQVKNHPNSGKQQLPRLKNCLKQGSLQSFDSLRGFQT